VSAPRPLRAQESRREAQALFESARELIGAGRYAEACPLLERSQALDPGIGTRFNLARCYELSGRLATAYSTYERAIAEMHAAGQTSREAVAQELLAVLEPRLAHLELAVRLDGMEPGFELLLDGVRVERTAWATAIPVDPGIHRVSASAPASQSWRTEFTVDHDAQNVHVDVPPLAPQLIVGPTSPLPPVAREAPSGRVRPQRTIALVLGALGLGGVGVGSYYGIRAISLNAQLGSACNGGCDSPGAGSLAHDSRYAGDASTISFAIGGALLAAAAVLWITAPADSARP
jgi:serine/threonine-protein kinase